MHMRRLWVGLGLSAVALAGGAFWIREREARHFRAELEQASRELAEGHPNRAASRLSQLARAWPGRGEVSYQLGLCEQARGRIGAALRAWAEVPKQSTFAGWAATRRARVEIQRGRLADAEDLLVDSLDTPGTHAAEARSGLVRLLRSEGRFDEARRLFLAGFHEWADPVAALRELYRLDIDPFPVGGVRIYLANAERQAPDDDRAWLGQAHLSTRTGQFADADRWLAACQRRRPNDPAVWRTRLEWALAADRPEEARRALPHIPAGEEVEVLSLFLEAWFAGRGSDRDAERIALEQLRHLDPADTKALDRLAELAIEAGQIDVAKWYRRQKDDVNRARDAYAALLGSPDPRAHAHELARLAETLGRRFDAEWWARIAVQTHSSPQAAPAAPTQPPRTDSSRKTLADLLPELAVARPSTPLTSSAKSESSATAPRFVDDAEAAGLRFFHDNGGSRGRLIPPVTSSGGVALIDYDSDGWLDVYVVQGGPFPPDPQSPRDGDRLFRNRGDGTFLDVTEASGIAAMARGYGHGVTVGDYDNDGHPDLFVTRWRSYALYRNRGDARFEDVTEAAGLGGERDWPTSSAFADLDGDGDLDLYVCHYLVWDEHDPRSCSDRADPTRYKCSPRDFPSLPDHVFRNDGGRFVDVTDAANCVDRDGRGLGVVAADLDDDNRVDLFVANDTTANYLFRNLGGFRFEEIAHAAGAAANANGGYQAGMGVACGDLDGDGRPDLVVTNFYNESTTFFRNLGQGFFVDHTAAAGLAAPSRYLLGFGAALLDVNNDGRLDLLTANGHVHDGRPQFPWMMPVQLLLGRPGVRLSDVSAQAGAPFQVLRMGRGLAAGDLDNDGRIDALVLSQNEPLAYFHNRTEGGHSVTVQLEGRTSNRDAVGARVTVSAGGRPQVAQRCGGGSYQSAGDPRLHFGLESSTRVQWIEVRWPSGRLDRYESLAADTGYRLREGESLAIPAEGWRH